MSLQIGPLSIPTVVLSLLFSLIAARLIVPVVFQKAGFSDSSGEVKRIFDIGSTSLLIALMLWKLFPLLTTWKEISQDPSILLRIPGGSGGAVVGVSIGVLYGIYRIYKSRTLERPVTSVSIVLVFVALVTLPTNGVLTLTLNATPENVGSRRPPDDVSFTLIDGSTVTLSDLKGNPVVLTFWATWCGPCRSEIPYKKRLYEDLHEEVSFIAVNLTRTEASREAVIEFTDREDLPYPIALDLNGSLSNTFMVRSTPTTVILDGEGEIQARWVGPSSYDRVFRALRTLR